MFTIQGFSTTKDITKQIVDSGAPITLPFETVGNLFIQNPTDIVFFKKDGSEQIIKPAVFVKGEMKREMTVQEETDIKSGVVTVAELEKAEEEKPVKPAPEKIIL